MPPARLKGKYAVSALFERGASASGKNLAVRLILREDGTTRAAALSPKNTGCAVARVRLRRRLRAVLHELADQLPQADLVIIGRAGALAAPFAELKSDLEKTLAKALRRAQT